MMEKDCLKHGLVVGRLMETGLWVGAGPATE